MDDRELINGIAAQDRSAMRLLYERYCDPLHAFLIGRGADQAAASDVVHDAMLEVWRSAAKFQGNSTVKTWLYAIARNKLTDRFRRSGRMSYVEDVPEMVDDAPNPEAAAMAASDNTRLRACLDKLKAAHKSAIRLAFFEDLTYEEIGRIEEVPVGTIKTRIHHAKQLLMRCLGRR